MRVSGIGEGVLFYRSYGPLCTWMYGMQVLQEQKPVPGPSRASSLALVTEKQYTLPNPLLNSLFFLNSNSPAFTGEAREVHSHSLCNYLL